MKTADFVNVSVYLASSATALVLPLCLTAGESGQCQPIAEQAAVS